MQLISTCERWARVKEEEEEARTTSNTKRSFRMLCMKCIRMYLDEKMMTTLDIATAPLREEFLNMTTTRTTATTTPKPSENDANSAQKKKKKKKRKMHARDAQDDKLTFCMRTMRGEECQFGEEKCRHSHNREGFLKSKPPDIEGSVCPWTRACMPCPFGITCRFATSHRIIETPGPAAAAAAAAAANGTETAATPTTAITCTIEKEKNVLYDLVGLQKCLQKGRVYYPQCDTYFKANGITELEAQRKKNADGQSTSLATFAREKRAEKKTRSIDFRNKLYLAPLTTVGNLPFRRVCITQGADITCGEMALATNLVRGSSSEWALLRRHPSEKLFGVQLCGGYANAVAKAAELVDTSCDVDFIDINMGCPIDLVCDKGAGSALLLKPRRIEEMVRAASNVISCPLTFKTRISYGNDATITKYAAKKIIESAPSWGAAAVTLHGRTRQQRYTRQAEWKYIYDVAKTVHHVPLSSPETDRNAHSNFHLIGNGDIYTYTDYNRHVQESIAYEEEKNEREEMKEEEEEEEQQQQCDAKVCRTSTSLSTVMIARGALIKPWIFREIKEQRHIDLSVGERLDIFADFVKFGLEHWGSDERGVASCRRFLLEMMSFTHRYVPHGLLQVQPPHLHWRPSPFVGRSDMETKLSSRDPKDWIEVSEMFLGPVPDDFSFTGKHKSNAYEGEANG